MTGIRFSGVSKRFAGNIEVIRDLNLCVEEGEFMVLVGPSGCAKSTTLRMIAGLEAVTAGDIFIGGVRANRLAPAERNISMVFQSYALFPNMSVRENLSFGLKIRRTGADAVRREVERVAAMLGLVELLDRRPRQLSGGQAQRVALGRAMIRNPAAFLFDEPLSNLDAELRVQMRGEIVRMQQELGTTTVYVTHDQVEAMTMGHRIAVMERGRIMQVGRPIELYERPANVFVGGFIGSPRMNLHRAEALFSDTGPRAPAVPAMSMIGVRPEHVTIGDRLGDGVIGLGQGRIERVEDLGHEALVHLTLPSGLGIMARTGGERRGELVPGSEVPVTIWRERLHVFAADSGERVR